MRVSVILTTYNSAKSIQRTLNSILSQKGNGSVFDLELLVVDDAAQWVNILANLFNNNGHDAMGRLARNRVIEAYSWQSSLAPLQNIFDTGAGA